MTTYDFIGRKVPGDYQYVILEYREIGGGTWLSGAVPIVQSHITEKLTWLYQLKEKKKSSKTTR